MFKNYSKDKIYFYSKSLGVKIYSESLDLKIYSIFSIILIHFIANKFSVLKSTQFFVGGFKIKLIAVKIIFFISIKRARICETAVWTYYKVKSGYCSTKKLKAKNKK